MIKISKFSLNKYQARIEQLSIPSLKEARREFLKALYESGSKVGNFLLIPSDDICLPSELSDTIIRSLPLSLEEKITVKKIVPYQDNRKVCTLHQKDS